MSRTEHSSLTGRQEKFCQEYLKCLNADKAAKAAGYKWNEGTKLLQKTHIQTHIKSLKKPLETAFEAERDAFIAQLKRERDWNIFDFFDFGDPNAPRFKGNELPREFGRLLTGLTTFVNPKTGEKVTKYHFVDRHKAEALLAKYFSVDQKGIDKGSQDSAKVAREAWERQKKESRKTNLLFRRPR